MQIMEGQQRIELSLPDEKAPGYGIHYLLRTAEDMSLSGNGLINLAFEEFEKVKKLRCWDSSNMSHLISPKNEAVFCFLESLDLEKLTNLQEVCHGPVPAGSFLNLRDMKIYEMPALLHLWKNPDPNSPLVNLRSINIKNCRHLRHLFTLSTARSFDQLEELKILFCRDMTEVLLNDLDNTTVSIAFPRLKKFILNSLPSLVAFCRGIRSMKFPQVHLLSITNLPKLHGLLPENGSNHVFFDHEVEFGELKELFLNGLDPDSSQIWFPTIPTISHFHKLEKLLICACEKLQYLFSYPIATALVHLKDLEIKNSLMMAEVIRNVEQETERTLFPSLEKLELWQLRSLRSFCQWKQDLEMPSLRHVSICMCPEMQTFTLGSLITPQLEHLEVENEQLIEIKDLNGALRRRFRGKLAFEASSATSGKR